MTENPKIGVPVRPLNPSGFVGQKSGPETSLRAALAEGDENQVFPVRCNDKEEMPFGRVMACYGRGKTSGFTTFTGWPAAKAKIWSTAAPNVLAPERAENG